MKKEKKQWYYDRRCDDIFVPVRIGNQFFRPTHAKRLCPFGTPEVSIDIEDSDECYKLRVTNEITMHLVVREFNDAMDRMKYQNPSAIQRMPDIYKYCKARKKKHDDEYLSARFKHKALAHG